MSERKTDDTTLIAALRILARDIQSGDSCANACLLEVAARLAELVEERRSITTLLGKVETLEAENKRLREARMTADEREALELSLELQWPKTGEQWKALSACLGPVCVAPANKHKVAIRSLLARQPLPPGPEANG